MPDPASDRIRGRGIRTKTTRGRGRGAAGATTFGRDRPIVERTTGLSDRTSATIGLLQRSCDARNHLPCGPSKLDTFGSGVRLATTTGRARDSAGVVTVTCGSGLPTIEWVDGL